MNENKENKSDKLDGDSVSLSSKSKFLSWLDNFWFHYKWVVIIGAFFVIILVIGIVQIVSRENYDGRVTFAGPANITPNQSLAIEQELSRLLPDDYSGDKKKNAKFVTYSIYTDEDFTGETESTVNTQQNSTNKKEYDNYVSSGECSIYFVSSYLYENFKTRERLQSMEFMFGENMPDAITDDGYAVKLSDLPIYELEAFSVLPEDTYVCFLKSYVYGESSKEDRYAEQMEFFRAIVNFGN